MNNKPKMTPLKGNPLSTDKAQNFNETIKKLFKSISKYKLSLIIVSVFAIASTIFSIVGPKILGEAINELANGLIAKLSGTGNINFGKIGYILLFLLILYIISALFSYIQGFIMASISQKYTYNLRKEVSKKLNRLPISYFDKKTNGEILSVITNDIDTLSQGLNQSAIQLITSTFTLIGVLIMMLSINVTMTIITILILPLSAVIVMFVVKNSQKHFTNQQNYLATINGNIEEMYSGHSIVKAFNAEEKLLDKFEKQNNILCESAWKSGFISGLMHPVMVFIGNIGYVVVSIVGGVMAIQGKISIGNIQSFITYTRNFTGPVAQLAQVSNMIQSMVASAERIFAFLDENEEKITVKDASDTSNIIGNVEFKNVSFGYNENEMIIKNFNTKVKKGQKIAIVGPTGAGKTTIIKLLMRFYNVNDGSILIDGHDIKNFNRDNLHKLFGMVLQDTWLFTGTIMDNIKYGKLDSTDDEAIEAAKLAHVHHFIQTLPDSYDMLINEETNNISQGQKQLLTIARAILANPKILILDEATSNVDTRTEILIQKAMDGLMKGRTSFVIAHRLSTIKNADLILVMQDGNIVEQGNHETLLKKNGFYYNLYHSQFQNK